MLGITNVDLVTVIVFSRIADIETAHSVWFPCLLCIWCDMCFDFESKWCEGVCIIMFAPEVCIC